MMSDKDNNLLKSDILTVGSELSEKLNAIGVPNTFGKASEGKDNLVSIIRMTINGIDMIIEQIREKFKDYYNKSEVNTLLNGKSDTSHNHDSAYASINHNHNDDYSDINHNHDSAYAKISHNHDNAYASKSHQHDSAYAKISHNHDNAYYNKSEVNTLLNGKSDTSHNHDNAYASKNHNHDNAYANISHNHDNAYASKKQVVLMYDDISTKIGTIEGDITSINGDIISLNNSITNLNTRVKSGKVDGISVKKQNVAGRTVTHNLGRPNFPVVTLNIGNSSSYAWGSTQATVYDVTNNDFKVKIYNNTESNGNFSFNWVVVATD